MSILVINARFIGKASRILKREGFASRLMIRKRRQFSMTMTSPTSLSRWAPEESDMPAISRFYGIVIKMYYNEHGVPHFHAIYSEDAASIAISNKGLLGGYLPGIAMKLVNEWAGLHENELLENWGRANRGEPLLAIPGLE
jgi:hypothetical protein